MLKRYQLDYLHGSFETPSTAPLTNPTKTKPLTPKESKRLCLTNMLRSNAGEDLLPLFANYHAAESRCKGIEQHAGDNHKGPSLCDEAGPTREERTAFNRSESSLEGNLAKTDHHKKERGTDDRTGDLV